MTDTLKQFDDEIESLSNNIVTTKTESQVVKNDSLKTKIQSYSFVNKTNNYSKNNSFKSEEFKWKFASNFPEIKFYFLHLEKVILDIFQSVEMMKLVQKIWVWFNTGDDIVLIDCGVQFADWDMLWANYAIPDVSFLTKYIKNIKWFVITHAHLDHIGGLKHILPALWMPTLYGTRLTLWIVKKQLEEAWLLSKAVLVEIDADKREYTKIWAFDIEFFRVNHSVPDSAWLYITPAIDTPADLERYEGFGKRWVSMLLSDSTWSIRKWFSMSEKNVWEALDELVANHKKWRLIIATFSSWISRIQQLIDSAEKHGKYIFLSGRSMVENIAIAKELGYLRYKDWIVKKMTPKSTEWILPHNQIIITTWSQWEEFSALTRMAWWQHPSLEILKDDTVVFSSSVVPGNEKSVIGIINKLIHLWANVVTKDDWEIHTWGHAFVEEQKLMLKLAKPKYFMPIYGDLYFRSLHKATAVSQGFPDDNVLMIDNWHIVDFSPNNGHVFKSRIKVPMEKIIIDGHGIWTATSHVIKAREKMMNSGVLVLNFKVDKKTKAILGHIKLETRWLVYIDEVREIHRMILKKAKEVYENTVKDVPDMQEKDLLKIVRTDLETFLQKKLDREPMIIPMITEI